MTAHQETGKEMGTPVVKPDLPTTTSHSCPSLSEYTWGLLLVAKGEKSTLSKAYSTDTSGINFKSVARNKSFFFPLQLVFMLRFCLCKNHINIYTSKPDQLEMTDNPFWYCHVKQRCY